jgi:MFS family permease
VYLRGHCKRINCACNECTYMHRVCHMASLQGQRTQLATTTETTWTPQLWGILLVLGGALLLDGLDVSMVGVALPSIRTALHMSTSSLQWIVSGYTLGYGGLLLLGGRAADLLGRRRVFIAGVAVFAVVSLLGGIVSSPGLLIAARIIKGMAAAFTAPSSLSLLTTTFPEGPVRNRAFSVYTVFGASGFSLGLVLSGLLTQVSWRLTLLVSAPAAALVLVGAITLIPRGGAASAPARAGRRSDLPGAGVITAAMLLLVYTVVNAQQAGWGSARTIGSFAGVAVLAALFAVVETRSSDPLVPFGIFRSAPLRRAQVGAVTLFGSYVSFQFLLTQYLQSLSHWSAIGTAMAFLPAGVIVAILSLRTAGLLSRFGAEGLVATAFVALVASYALFLRAGVTPDYPAVMLPTVILLGVAFGFGFSALTVSATSGVRNEQQGLAASLFQTSFQVGGAIVLAVVTAVVEAGGANTLTSPSAVLSAYRPALYLITGVAALGLLAALPGLRRGAALEAGEADQFIGVEAPAVAAAPEVARPDTPSQIE